MKLDKSKPFGTVHGSEDGTAFEQDGVLFDSFGNQIIEEKSVKTSKQDKSNEPVATN